MLVVRLVDFKGKNPVKDVNIKIFRLEKEPITLKQWGENLKTGGGFKRLMFSVNSDNDGAAKVELAEGTYEIQVEKYGSNQLCELNQNETVTFVEPKKHWWQ